MSTKMVILARIDLRNIDERRRMARAMTASPEVVFRIHMHIGNDSYIECDSLDEARQMLEQLLADHRPPIAASRPTETP